MGGKAVYGKDGAITGESGQEYKFNVNSPTGSSQVTVNGADGKPITFQLGKDQQWQRDGKNLSDQDVELLAGALQEMKTAAQTVKQNGHTAKEKEAGTDAENLLRL